MERARWREGGAMVERIWWVVRGMRGGCMVGGEAGGAHCCMSERFQVVTMENKVTWSILCCIGRLFEELEFR